MSSNTVKEAKVQNGLMTEANERWRALIKRTEELEKRVARLEGEKEVEPLPPSLGEPPSIRGDPPNYEMMYHL